MSGRKVFSNTYPLNRPTSRILTGGQHVDRTYDVVIRKLKNGYLSDDADSENEFWESPILASEFSPAYHNQAVLAFGNEFGKLFLWKMKRKLVQPLHSVQAHQDPIYDLVWTPKEKNILTVSNDKTAVLWDANGPTVRMIVTFHAHQTTIKSAAWNPESDNIFATGDKNSSIFLWDRRLLGPVKKIYQAHDHSNVSRHCKNPYSNKTSITGMGFNGTHCLITCAAVSECIKFWDMRNTASAENPHSIKQLRYPEYSDKSGYAYLTIDHTRQWLYVTTVEDRIYAFALSTSEITPMAVFIGACLRSFHIKSSLSPDGQYLVSGSSRDCSMIWRTKENVGRVVKPLRKLETYGSEVNAVSWSRTPGDSFKVVTFPEYRSVQVWDINPINVPEGSWEIMAPLPDDGDFGSDDKVSDVEEKLKLNERSWMGWSELSCHSKSDLSALDYITGIQLLRERGGFGVDSSSNSSSSANSPVNPRRSFVERNLARPNFQELDSDSSDEDQVQDLD